ncbi:hypothetical protein KSS87_020074 [Heliosperma pusillum]|nr:hypothetical protein KSS87_020074 [Heliosperma pusillum]
MTHESRLMAEWQPQRLNPSENAVVESKFVVCGNKRVIILEEI